MPVKSETVTVIIKSLIFIVNQPIKVNGAGRAACLIPLLYSTSMLCVVKSCMSSCPVMCSYIMYE